MIYYSILLPTDNDNKSKGALNPHVLPNMELNPKKNSDKKDKIEDLDCSDQDNELTPKNGMNYPFYGNVEQQKCDSGEPLMGLPTLEYAS